MRKDGIAVRRAHVRLAADRPEGPADRLDDVDDQHHRGQAHPRPAVGLARALHDRARRRSTPRSRCCRCSRASCCSPTARTGSGSAPTRTATAHARGRRLRRCSRSRRATTPSTAFGGLPTQELTAAGSDSREVFVEPLAKWFDVRARYLQWTDGRLAQMLIATDITAAPQRRGAGRAARPRRRRSTSRLVTMGEMASSVAHELNQPLTAITNYCNGMVTRVKNDAIDKDDLIAALEKTSRQAQRAGQIIHRIRSFVKRSEPQRQTASGADDRRRRGRPRRHRAAPAQRRASTPTSRSACRTLMVDPILIEQVLLNLLKNAAEAIDNAQLPPARRSIELRVVPRHTRRGRRRDRVLGQRHGPGPEGRGHRAACTRRSSRPRSTAWASACSLCRSIIESHQGRIKAENLYNGDDRRRLPLLVHAAGRRPYRFTRQHRRGRHCMSLIPEEGHRLCRRRRRGRARFAAMAARRQGLPRQVLRLRRVLPRPASTRAKSPA